MDAPPSWGGIPEEQPLNGEVDWASAHELASVRWVDRPLLQAATFHLLCGRPDVGKGALCARWIARCTNGEMYGRPRNALWLSSEEDAKLDLGPRLEAAGADRSRVAYIPKRFRLPKDTDWLATFATETVGDVGLIVLDPLANHIGTTESNADEEVRIALQPCARICSEIDVPMLGIRHLTIKEARAGVLAAILGSTAWVGVPRAVLAAVVDDEGLLRVHAIKGNRVPKQEAGRMFMLDGADIGLDEPVVRAVELGESIADLDDLLEKSTRKKAGPTVAKKIEETLIRILREHIGQMESDLLDSKVAIEVGTTARYVQNQRRVLRDRGWLRSYGERGPDGQVRKWTVTLTNACPYTNDLEDQLSYSAGNSTGSLSDIEELESSAQLGIWMKSDGHLDEISPQSPEPPSGRPDTSDDGRTLDEALQDPEFLLGLMNEGIVESYEDANEEAPPRT